MGQQCTERGEIYEFKPPAAIINPHPTKIIQPQPPKTDAAPFRHLSPSINERLSQLRYCLQDLQQIQSQQVKHFPNGLIYQGTIENNQMHGMGRLIMPDGSYYQGSFSRNQINGDGILINSQGFYYLGHFKNNKAEGSGKYVGLDFTYQGEFKQNLQSGFGRLIKANEIYEGTFEKGKKKKGKLKKVSEGTVYEGAFQGDTENGHGRLTVKNETYEGMFQDGIIEGEAKLILANGDTKTVYFRNGKKAERVKNESIEAYKSSKAHLNHQRLIKTT